MVRVRVGAPSPALLADVPRAKWGRRAPLSLHPSQRDLRPRRIHAGPSARYHVLSAALLVLGCSGPTHDELRADARERLADFEVFDAWARRAVEADPAFGDRAALEETVLAPIVREDVVLAAAIGRGGVSIVTFGDDVSSVAKEWVSLPLEDAVRLDVTAAKLADPRAPPPSRERISCIVLRRTAPLADGVDVSVTVAYRNAD